MTKKVTKLEKTVFFREQKPKMVGFFNNKNIVHALVFFIGKKQIHLLFPIFFSPKFTHREIPEKT